MWTVVHERSCIFNNGIVFIAIFCFLNKEYNDLFSVESTVKVLILILPAQKKEHNKNKNKQHTVKLLTAYTFAWDDRTKKKTLRTKVCNGGQY